MATRTSGRASKHGFQVFAEPLESRRLLSSAPTFATTNLVSDGSVPAAQIDKNLVNPWGVAFAPGGEFWISANNSGKSTLYDGTGAIFPLVVNIPGPGGTQGTPTGQIFNGAGGFTVSESGKSGPALFITDSEDGTIAGWAPSVDPTNAIIAVDHSATAVYKGLAIASVGGASRLFAADFRGGSIDVFDSSFHQVTQPARAFGDKHIPAGYAPFNVQNLNGDLYVTYARQNAARHDDVGGPGRGFVDVFNTSGKLIRRLEHGSLLSSPWGLAIAPGTFGRYAGDVLVGNFKSGLIDVFSPRGGRFISVLKDAKQKNIQIDGLWGLSIGSGGPTESTGKLYFTAGVNGEQDGLLGSIVLNPVIKPGKGGGGSNTGFNY